MPDLAVTDDDFPTELDNEGGNSLVWEHKLEHEQTQLRKLFMQEMEQLRPDWIATMESQTTRVDFETVVHNCDNSWVFKIVKR